MASADAILTEARNYAKDLLAGAQKEVANTIRTLGLIDLEPGQVPYLSSYVPPPPAFFTPGDPNISFTPPEEPSGLVPEFDAIPNIDISGAPSGDVDAPKLEAVTPPSPLSGFTKEAPQIEIEALIPDAPDYIKPDHPVLGGYVVPSPVQLTLPEFTETSISSPPTVDEDAGTIIGRAYRDVAPSFVAALSGYLDTVLLKYNPRYHTQMQAVEDQLARYMQGGTGLDPTVEDAIYARARDKNNAEARRAIGSAYADAASRGFTLPAGGMLSAIQTARQAAADNNARAATEIAIAQAEMEQKNLHFAVTTSTGLRTAVMSSLIQYAQVLATLNGQALEYAKAVLSGVIEAYNLGVKKAELELEVLKSHVLVYETRMKGAALKMEMYRSEIAALEAMVNVDRARVDMFRSQVDAASAEMAVYKTRIDAVVSVATLKKIQMELFSTEVQAYGIQVQAKEAEWRGYSAALQGEETKIKLYQAQLDALKIQHGIYQSRVEAQSSIAKIHVERNNAKAIEAKASADAYQVRMQAAQAGFSADLSMAKLQLDSYQVETKAKFDYASLDMQASMSRFQQRAEHAKLIQVNYGESLRAKVAYLGTIAQVSAITGDAYSGMAQSALSGINVLAAQTETI